MYLGSVFCCKDFTFGQGGVGVGECPDEKDKILMSTQGRRPIDIDNNYLPCLFVFALQV